MVIFLRHMCSISIAVPQRFDCCFLADHRCAHNRVLVDLPCLCNDFGRCSHPAQTPAGHGKCLREAVDDDCALAHAVQLRDGHMLCAVGQLGVDFIGQHHDIRAAQHLRKLFVVLAGHDCSGRVIRVGEHQQLGFRCDCRLQLLRRQTELIFLFRRQRDRHAVRH